MGNSPKNNQVFAFISSQASFNINYYRTFSSSSQRRVEQWIYNQTWCPTNWRKYLISITQNQKGQGNCLRKVYIHLPGQKLRRDGLYKKCKLQPNTRVILWYEKQGKRIEINNFKLGVGLTAIFVDKLGIARDVYRDVEFIWQNYGEKQLGETVMQFLVTATN